MASTCGVCGERARAEIPSYAAMPRVSSDCKPVPPGGRLMVCGACGAISKPVTPELLQEIGAIYAGYDPYYQGGGVEQLVHDALLGGEARRSQVICRHLGDAAQLDGGPLGKQAVDVGCGNGGFLRALAEAFPGWRLQGLELDGRHLPLLAAIPGFAGLQVGDVSMLRGRFHLITMIHALEHFLDPCGTLATLRAHLEEGGHVFVQVPDVQANPFDLLIADHVTHFTIGTLERILARAGLSASSLASDWVPKECSVVAVAGADARRAGRWSPALGIAERHLAWLTATLQAAERAAVLGTTLGLFGTSIAATWLAGALGDTVGFFVDEDQSRQGRRFLGRPVLAPTQIPRGSAVFVGLAPVVAEVVTRRLRLVAPDAIVAAPPPLLPDPAQHGR